MRKIALIFITLISINAFAQKAELKSAEKAFKKGDLTTAEEMINKACKLKDQADDKTKAKILYTKANIYAKLGSKDFNYYEKSLKVINKLKEFENKINKKRYSDDAEKIKASLTNEVLNLVNNNLKNKNYTELQKTGMIAYKLTGDEQFKYFASVAALVEKNYPVAEKLLLELYDSGYTGQKEIYTVKEKETGKRVVVQDEKSGKLLIMAGTHEDLKKEKTPSARPDIIANILYIYTQLGKDDEAIEFIAKAKNEDPNNIDLIIGEGNYYLKKGDNVKFAESMQKAVEIEPDNKLFNFNLATALYELQKYEEAKKYYEKTIELDPNYVDAYKGLAYIILVPEEKITEEMNKDEVLMNDALFNKYNKQRMDLYKKTLPVLEKGLEVAPNDETILIMLKKIYRDLKMDDKYNQVKNKLDEIKEKK